MKKILITIAFLIVACVSYAQHLPLKHIEVGDYPTTEIRKSFSNNFANTINPYSAKFCFTWGIYHEVGFKDPDLNFCTWGLEMNLNTKQDLTLKIKASTTQGFGDLLQGVKPLYLSVGETTYPVRTWYYATDSKHLMLDFYKGIVEHISISGLQGIYVNIPSEDSQLIKFTDVEQELWRRSAEEVYSKRKVYN